MSQKLHVLLTMKFEACSQTGMHILPHKAVTQSKKVPAHKGVDDQIIMMKK